MRKNIKTESGAPGSQRVRERCLQLLQQQPGLDLTALDDSLQAYSGLIQRWNPMASLVSSRDSEHLWLHITDSLSLLPAVRSCGGASPRLFDIGSGAGFPALPLALTGIQPAGPASRWLIGGPDERAVNIPGQPRRIDIVQADGLDAAQPLEVPARSCVLYLSLIHI